MVIGQVPPEPSGHRVDQRRDRPLHHLVADVPDQLGQIERGGLLPERLPQVGNVVQHAQVPARVLPDHALRRLGQIGHLHHRHGLDEHAAAAQGIAERGVLGGAGGREAADRLHDVQAHELVVAQADLRAAEEQLEGGADEPGQARQPRGDPLEQAHPLHLVQQARDRHADEDGRLLNRADLPADAEPIVVGEGQGDALIGEAPLPGQLAVRDPAIGVRIGDRVRVADPHEHARRVDRLAQHLPQHLRPEGPVQLVRLAPRARHRHVGEALLLIGGQRLAQATDQLAGADAHRGVRGVLLLLLGHHHHVEAAVRVA